MHREKTLHLACFKNKQVLLLGLLLTSSASLGKTLSTTELLVPPHAKCLSKRLKGRYYENDLSSVIYMEVTIMWLYLPLNAHVSLQWPPDLYILEMPLFWALILVSSCRTHTRGMKANPVGNSC